MIQTLSRLRSLRPDFGRNAYWLLEQCHKIWLAVGNAGSWKHLFLAWLFSWMIRRRWREGSILLSFLLFYGLMVGKYALICAMEIQKIHMVVHIFSGFALFTESECIAELNPSASCWPLTRCFLIYQQTSADQNTVHLKSGFIWKFSREWLFWTGYASGGSLRKKPQSPTVKYYIKRKHRIAVQGILVCIIIKAGGASVKVTDLFAFACCKNKPGKLVSSLVWLFAVC